MGRNEMVDGKVLVPALRYPAFPFLFFSDFSYQARQAKQGKAAGVFFSVCFIDWFADSGKWAGALHYISIAHYIISGAFGGMKERVTLIAWSFEAVFRGLKLEL